MEKNKVVNKETIEDRYKVMIEEIDNLSQLFNMVLMTPECKEIDSLKTIKEQYIKIYNKIVDEEKFNLYNKAEEIIIDKIAEIEVDLNECVYDSADKCKDIILSQIPSKEQIENFANSYNLSDELEKIELLKKLLNLYSPNITDDEIEEIQYEISSYKFNILFRKQIEELIYENGSEDSNLKNYDDKNERKCFEELIKEKIKSVSELMSLNELELDKVLEIKPDKIIEDKDLLERLIILDMTTGNVQTKYLSLLDAKIFNAHLCNIADNPFERLRYISGRTMRIRELQFPDIGLKSWRRDEKYRDRHYSLKTNQANFSLLKALLKNIITNENISIVECEKLYNRFGFYCNPITFTDGQKILKLLWLKVRDDVRKEYNKKNKGHKVNKQNERKFCKINFEGLAYEFYDLPIEKPLDEIISKREIKSYSKIVKKRFSKKAKQVPEKKYVKEKVRKIETRGALNTDIDIIILLLKKQFDTKENSNLSEDNNNYFGNLSVNVIEELEKLKNKNGKLTLEEKKRILFIMKDYYRTLDIDYNEWEILPLEDVLNEVWKAPMPKKRETSYSHNHSLWGRYDSDDYYEQNHYRNHYKKDESFLWKKYLGDFKYHLGIDILSYSKFSEINGFEIYVNLDDISDLPIDYKKIQFLTNDEKDTIVQKSRDYESRDNELWF